MPEDLQNFKLYVERTFASLAQLAKVEAKVDRLDSRQAESAQDISSMQSELVGIHRVLNRMSRNIEKVVWIVFAALMGAILKQVLGI